MNNNVENLTLVDNDLGLEQEKVTDSVVLEKEMTEEEALNAQKREEFEKFLTELDAEGKKLIIIPDISIEIRNRIDEIIIALHALKEEVLTKKGQALEKSSVIQHKLNALIASGKVKVDGEEYKNSEESVKRYGGVLDHIVSEIEKEIEYFTFFTTVKLPTSMIAYQFEPSYFPDYMGLKIKLIKKYMKNIAKDLNVSYSRYCYGFDTQIKRIVYIESYVGGVNNLQPQEHQARV